MFKKSLLMMLFVALLAPWAVGQTYYYERITSAPTTDGNYLLVYEASSTSGNAFNGTLSSNSGQQVEVSISSGKINSYAGTATISFEDSDETGYYYIKNSSSNKYFYASSTSLYEGATASGNQYKWQITIASDGKATLYNKSTKNNLKYNTIWYFYPGAPLDVYLYEEKTSTVPSVVVTPASVKIAEDGTAILTATVNNAPSATVTWSTSDATVADISTTTGITTTVTGTAEGSATVTASITVDNVDYTATCAVTVSNEFLMQNGSVTTCKGTFYDDGGTSNYVNYLSHNMTFTINPGTPGKMVQANFTSFIIEDFSGEYLEIFDGTTTSATLIKKCTGSDDNNTTFTITANNEDGALTFHFVTDYSGVDAGWVATIACVDPASYEFAEASYVVYNAATVNWTGGTAPFTVEYKKNTDASYITASANVNARSYNLTGLDPETAYDVQVTDANSYVITEEEYFTTPVMPLALLPASNITNNSARVNWTGGKANYKVEYRINNASTWQTVNNVSATHCDLTDLTPGKMYDIRVTDANESNQLQLKYFTTDAYVDYANSFTENFNNNTWPLPGWSTSGSNSTVWTRNTSTSYATAYDGANVYCWYSSNATQYLILPNVQISNDVSYVQLSFMSYTYYPSDYSKSSIVLLDGSNEVELKNLDTEADHTAAWQEIVVNLSAYKGTTVSIAFKYEGNNAHAWYIDNVAISAYHKVFVGGTGYWNVATNWMNGVPGADDNVSINAACTIPNGTLATANNITLNGGSLTIANGGRLITNSTVTATVQKTIADWNTTNWYFIASPISANVNPATDGMYMITDNLGNTATTETATYDLYSLDVTQAQEEWQNYRQHNFNLINGMGYLYASKNGTTLNFTGNIQPSNTNVTVSDLNDGFNLVGNPYTCEAYVNQPYYTLSQVADVVTSATIATANSVAIAPLTGVVISGTSATFSKTPANSGSSKGALEMTITKNGGRSVATLDNAIVSFGEGSKLEKFYFGTQDANIYIPQNGEQYAIVNADNQGEMPVNFKANADGQYTISVSTDNVEMGYMHLVDMKNGMDIDLMATPSYTFEAKANDNAGRFRLLFRATGVEENMSDSEEGFAFVSNGQIIVAGEGTLRIIDMLGRTVGSYNSSERISTEGLTSGVYVLQLIGGEKTMTQKIVVR